MFGLGVQEILIILIIGGLVFGARKLPEIGAGLGQGIKNFRKSLKDEDSKHLDSGGDENSSNSTEIK